MFGKRFIPLPEMGSARIFDEAVTLEGGGKHGRFRRIEIVCGAGMKSGMLS